MLSVAQISFHCDALARPPTELLRVWPTVVNVAQAAASAGVKVSVIQASTHVQALCQGDIDYHFLPLTEGSAFGELLASLKPDVLHVQGLGFSREVEALAALMPQTPIVLQDRSNRPPRNPLRWPLWRRGLSAAQGLMFCAEEQARPLRRRGLLPRGCKIYAVPGSTCRFQPMDSLEARRITGIGGDPCLLWVGNLERRKDPLTVLDGISMAARELPGLQLWCCFGSAPLSHAMRARIAADAQLVGRVHLLGQRPHTEIEQLMSAADFLVQGSHHESTGFTVIEALACGLPPLVTDIPSFRALTAGGAVGRLWPRGNARALAQALLHLSVQPLEAQRAAALERFESELSLRALGHKLHQAYADMR